MNTSVTNGPNADVESDSPGSSKPPETGSNGSPSIGKSGGSASGVCLSVKSEEDFLDEQAQLARAGVYELIARLFSRAPDQELLQVLADVGDVDSSQGQVAMGWELLKQSSKKTDVERVRDEYFGLFIGVGRGELVPFGSWYMTGFLMEKPVAILRADLKLFGIERNEDVAESEDHIAALCDAMAILIRHADEDNVGDDQAGGGHQLGGDVADEAFERQKKFFNDHIEPWAGRFFSDLQAADGAHFYRAAGFFGEAVFELEKEYFAMSA